VNGAAAIGQLLSRVRAIQRNSPAIAPGKPCFRSAPRRTWPRKKNDEEGTFAVRPLATPEALKFRGAKNDAGARPMAGSGLLDKPIRHLRRSHATAGGRGVKKKKKKTAHATRQSGLRVTRMAANEKRVRASWFRPSSKKLSERLSGQLPSSLMPPPLDNRSYREWADATCWGAACCYVAAVPTA
jgi:hypothetical protein